MAESLQDDSAGTPQKCTRDRLIDLGLVLFSEFGYHGTGIKQIVDSAGVPKGSFYNHFSSKENFAAEVIDTYVQRMMVLFDEISAMHASDPPAERIRAFHRAVVDRLQKEGWRRGCLIGSMAAEFAANSEDCSAALKRAAAQWETRVTRLLDEGQSRGEIRADVGARELAVQLWNAWQGALLRVQFERAGERLNASVDFMLQQLASPSSKRKSDRCD